MPGIGSGHIADMLARIRENEALKHRILRRRLKYVYYKTANGLNFKSKDANDAKLEVIRQNIREETRKERMVSLWAFITTLIVLVALYFLIRVVVADYQDLNEYKEEQILYPKTDDPSVYRPVENK